MVKNNRRWATIFHEYQNFINKKGLQFFSIGTKADINYTFDNNLKNVSLDGIISIKTMCKGIVFRNQSDIQKVIKLVPN